MKVYFAKGTVYVYASDDAVSRLGGSSDSFVIFLDKEGRRLDGFVAVQDGPRAWTERMSREELETSHRSKDDMKWAQPLGKSAADVFFGVRGD